LWEAPENSFRKWPALASNKNSLECDGQAIKTPAGVLLSVKVMAAQKVLVMRQ